MMFLMRSGVFCHALWDCRTTGYETEAEPETIPFALPNTIPYPFTVSNVHRCPLAVQRRMGISALDSQKKSTVKKCDRRKACVVYAWHSVNSAGCCSTSGQLFLSLYIAPRVFCTSGIIDARNFVGAFISAYNIQ